VKALFLVNGLGLGNSTRCHALVQRLFERHVSVHVVTSGNGLWYFKDREEVTSLHEVESLYYGSKHGHISIVRTLTSLARLFGIVRRNAARVRTLLAEIEPDVVVTDSDYTVWPVVRSGLPLVALNNSDGVHHAYRRFPDHPSSVRPQFYFVEEWDYLFHKFLPDLVVSPTLDPSLPESGPPYRRVGPIVRRGYEPVGSRTGVERAVVMLSGSVFGTPVVLQRDDYPVHIDVVGRPAPPDWRPTPRVAYHGKLMDNRALLREADVVVVNGGFSAVSEIFSMRKPMVVVPVPRHAEQWLNARTIVHLGVGLSSPEENLEQALLEAVRRVDEFRAGYARLSPAPDGAAQAADAILHLVDSRRAAAEARA
jgi:UDP:flavonoid glycosyltransferase YjiC (YdhE family)